MNAERIGQNVRSVRPDGDAPGAHEQAGSVHPTPEPPAQGALLCGRYRLEAPIGRGASAVVYRAVDEALGAPVAIKILLFDGILATPQARAADLGFREEAVAAMRLAHPKILRVYNYERHDPWEFLVMEFVPGEDLGRYRKRQPGSRLAPIDVTHIGVECLDALAYAHGVGIVHNDIKPSNILLTRAGAIKLCDFGLAGRAAAVQRRRILAGTPAFMSPERIRCEPTDGRSDLYSLAATLYAIASGRSMFGDDDAALVLHLFEPPPRSPYIAEPLYEVLSVAAAKNPDDRFQTASEMRSSLMWARQILLGGSTSTPALPPEPAAPLARTVVYSDVPLEGSSESDAPAIELEMPSSVTTPIADTSDMVAIGERAVAVAAGTALRVSAFRIDRTPVTNEAYALFLGATAEEPPAHWLGGRPPAERLDHPVVGVTLEQARRYAAWRGRRLPTTLEWKSAAHGPEGRLYPWGNEWDPLRCQCPECACTGTAPVGRFPEGATSDGIVDLIGNVWEWTEVDPRLPAESGFTWVLGGSFRHPCDTDETIPCTMVAVGNDYAYLGFRCALDAAGEES